MPSALEDFADVLTHGSRTVVRTDDDAAALAGVQRIRTDLWIEGPVCLPDLRDVDGTLLIHDVDGPSVELPQLQGVDGQLLVGHCTLGRLAFPRLAWVEMLWLQNCTIGAIELPQLTTVPGNLRLRDIRKLEKLLLPRLDMVGGILELADLPDLHSTLLLHLQSVGSLDVPGLAAIAALPQDLIPRFKEARQRPEPPTHLSWFNRKALDASRFIQRVTANIQPQPSEEPPEPPEARWIDAPEPWPAPTTPLLEGYPGIDPEDRTPEREWRGMLRAHKNVVRVTSQVELEALRGREVIEGDLRIAACTLVDLEPLAALEEVHGHLFVWRVEGLSQLRLPALKRADAVLIGRCDDLRSVELPALEEVAQLSCSCNNRLDNVRMPVLGRVKGTLEHFERRKGATSIGTLDLPQLERVDGTVKVNGTSLHTLQLPALRCANAIDVTSGIAHLHLPRLRQLQTLKLSQGPLREVRMPYARPESVAVAGIDSDSLRVHLPQVDRLEVGRCEALRTLELSALQQVVQLTVGCPRLEELATHALQEVAEFDLRNTAAPLRVELTDRLAALGGSAQSPWPLPDPEDLVISEVSQLAELPEQVAGLYIDLPAATADDLAPLQRLERVGGRLWVHLHRGPTRIELPALRQVGSLTMERCLGLEELTAPQLETAGELGVRVPSLVLPQLRRVDEFVVYGRLDAPLLERVGNLQAHSATAQSVWPSLQRANSIHIRNRDAKAISFPALRQVDKLSLKGRRVARVDLPVLHSAVSVDFGPLRALVHLNIPQLRTIEGDMALRMCDRLQEVQLPELRSLRALSLSRCPVLHTVAMSCLETRPSTFFRHVPEALQTDLEARLKEAPTDVEVTLITSVEQLEELRGVEAVTGHLVLKGLAAAEVELPALTHVGSLSVLDCERLRRVHLPRLAQVENVLGIVDCPALEHVGLPTLEESHRAGFVALPKLRRLELTSLRVVGLFVVSDLPNLTELLLPALKVVTESMLLAPPHGLSPQRLSELHNRFGKVISDGDLA